MTGPSATVVIAARDASATIGRAVRSARAQGPCPIILVDDHSSDATVALARREAPDLSVVRPPHHGPLGFTRQIGLNAVRTPYALWLDADDELLPGRAAQLVRRLAENDADLAFDEVDLVDGHTEAFLRRCPIPAFLEQPPFLLRLFERNYLPGVGQVAFRTASARAVGYDRELHGPEDIDFVLRALLSGMRTTLVHEVGYRMHTYPTSVSRQLDNQRGMYRRVLLKHTYSTVRATLRESGAPAGIVAWALASMATFRGEYRIALDFVNEAAGLMSNPSACSEPDGPCPMPDGWRVAFHRGTLQALIGDFARARTLLGRADSLASTPETANNLGVALAHLGDLRGAQTCFARALQDRPDYLDARLNQGASSPDRVTPHLLRRHASRTDYRLPPRDAGSPAARR